MKMIRSNGSLRVTDCSWLWGVLGLPLAAVFTWQSVLYLQRGGTPGETTITILGAVFSAAVATVLTQWSDFRFDAVARELAWTRRNIFRAQRGTIAFDRIGCAVVQFSWGGPAQGSKDFYRVALSTDSGIVPLTVSYQAGRVNDDRCRLIRSAVNELLGVRLASEDDNDILELDRGGNHVWAVLLAEKRLGLNSTEGQEYVKKLNAKEASR